MNLVGKIKTNKHINGIAVIVAFLFCYAANPFSIKSYAEENSNENIKISAPLVQPLAQPTTAVIIKTIDAPPVTAIQNGIKDTCNDLIHIKNIYDIKGRPGHEGKSIISQIQNNTTMPDVIITIGLPATILAYQSFPEQKILFTMINNPNEQGLTQDNLSGIRSDLPLYNQLQVIKSALPKLDQLGVIINPKYSLDETIAQLSDTASTLGLELTVIQTDTKTSTLKKNLLENIDNIDALLILPDQTIRQKKSLKFLKATTLKHKIPTLVSTSALVEYGFLIALVPDFYSMGEQAGKAVCKQQDLFLQDKNYSQFPELYKLSINLATAKKIGLQLPEELLLISNDTYE